MTNVLDPLVLDLVEWIAKEPRAYADVLDAWRTSCPRLTVWEDAVDRGFVVRKPVDGQGMLVAVTAAGQRFLREHGRFPYEKKAQKTAQEKTYSRMA
jgi:hypothetical protein